MWHIWSLCSDKWLNERWWVEGKGTWSISDTEAITMLFKKCIFVSHIKLSLILFYQLNSINCSVLILSFSPVFAFYFHQVSTHSSFKHNTFYIWDVLRSYFLIVFSKKAKKQKQNINLFLMTWVQWLCSLLYLLGNNTVYPCLWQS